MTVHQSIGAASNLAVAGYQRHESGQVDPVETLSIVEKYYGAWLHEVAVEEEVEHHILQNHPVPWLRELGEKSTIQHDQHHQLPFILRRSQEAKFSIQHDVPHTRQLVEHQPKELVPSLANFRLPALFHPLCGGRTRLPRKKPKCCLFVADVKFLVGNPQVAVVRTVAVYVKKQALLMSIAG